MFMKWMQRTVSLVLALSLILGTCPQGVRAEETEPVTETTEATVPETIAETIPETTAETVAETLPATESVSVESASETARQEPLLAVEESGSCGANITWTLNNHVLTLSGTGPMTDYTSSTVPWYYSRESITDVVIGSGITHIGNYAFCRFYGMKAFTLPDTVTSIGTGAFLNCLYVTDIQLPANLTVIGDSAFEACRDLVTLTLPDTVSSIGTGAFRSCEAMTGITLPQGLTKIPDEAFKECLVLRDITLPDTVTHIGKYAFSYCRGLTELDIPKGVTSIGSGAFYHCSGLTRMEIPDGVKGVLDSHLFWCCTSLAEITLPPNLSSIGYGAFYNCTSLTHITLPDKLTGIGEQAFEGCSALVSVSIPDTVTTIYNRAFYGCTSLASIILPKGITQIYPSCFSGCTSLSVVTIPETVTTISTYAFNGCTGLKKVYIPASVTSIWRDAFGSCSSLTDIYYSGTKEAWNQTDASNYLTGVTIHTSYGVHNSCGKSLFWEIGENGILTISGTGEMDDYSSGSPAPWKAESSSISQVVLENGVTSVGNRAFSSHYSLKTVSIPDSVTKIGQEAFSYCSELTAIHIPENVTQIGAHAFDYCRKAATINLPSGITRIEDYTFQNCAALQSITIPEGVTYIGNSAFRSCSSLTEIVIPEGVLTLGDYVFQSCSGLTSLTISKGVTSIGNFAFQHCKTLTAVHIPASVTYIGVSPFNGCTVLTDIYFGGTQAAWEALKVTVPEGVTVHYNHGVVTSGTCGANLSWNFDIEANTLTISGTGDMDDYDIATAPWYRSFSNQIHNVIIEAGVTSIGGHAFSYTGLKTITIPGTVTSIGPDALLATDVLSDVYFDGYLSEWNSLGITLDNNVSLHFVLTALQQQWVNEHMDYIFSDAYQQDIISGYDSWMLQIFRKAQDDGGVAAYDLAKGLSEDLDFELNGVETYELLLSLLLSDRSVMNAYNETFFENYCDNIATAGKALKDIGSTLDIPVDVAKNIENAYEAMTNSEAGSNAFFEAYKTLAEQFDKHFTTEEMTKALKDQRKLDFLGLGIESLFAAYGNLQDVLRYTENYRAYLNTSRYFKQALQTMGALAHYHANSAAGPFAYNPFNDLGYWESQLNWGEFQTALNNFIEALDEYEAEGAHAVASKRVEELGETGEDILNIVGKYGLEKLLGTIPVVKGLMAAKGILSVGVLCVGIASNVDDRLVALDMMTKVYCLSVLMDESIDACADAMDHDALEISMVFDESVQIYTSAQIIGLDYGVKYAELRLKNAINDYYDYLIYTDNVSEKKLNELNREINIFTGYIELLNMQKGRIRKIACHDPRLEYVPETDAIVSDFLDAQAFVVACPVSVTVTDPQGRQMALLTDNGSQVKEGYELYFRTIPLNDGSGQHIKVAIVPEDYQISVEGTDEGEMNAFVTDYTGDSDTVSMYLEVPVKKGSKGSFIKAPDKQEPVLTMDNASHEPVVNDVKPGDVNLDGEVTGDDALYLIWSTLFPQLYPITADADFDGNGVCNSDDAVILLWHTLLPEKNPLP